MLPANDLTFGVLCWHVIISLQLWPSISIHCPCVSLTLGFDDFYTLILRIKWMIHLNQTFNDLIALSILDEDWTYLITHHMKCWFCRFMCTVMFFFHLSKTITSSWFHSLCLETDLLAVLWIKDERELKKQRRKQSNRESARRSRLRKQV